MHYGLQENISLHPMKSLAYQYDGKDEGKLFDYIFSEEQKIPGTE